MFKLLAREPRFIAFGFMYTFGSSAGQTFFISIFVPAIAAALSLNDASFSLIYAGATIASALVLPFAGRLIDRADLLHYGAVVGIGLTLACFITAAATGPILLIAGIFALRLFGQGLMRHTAITAGARHFKEDRGSMLALVSLGHAIGEALLPLAAIALIGLIGWRASFAVSGVALGLLAALTALWLIRREGTFRRPFGSKEEREKATAGKAGLLSLPWFWLNLPLFVASPMLFTALIFHQGAIAEDFGQTLEIFAASFVAFAVTRVPSSLMAGPLVDRFTAKTLMPLHLIPAMAAVALLAFWHSSAMAIFAYMALLGLSSGFGGIIRPAIIAEAVAPQVLGAARSLTGSIMVLSTALGPALYGFLLTGAPWSGPMGFEPMGAVGLMWVSLGFFVVSSLLGWLGNLVLPFPGEDGHRSSAAPAQ